MIKIKITEIHDSKKETFLFNKALIRKIFSNTFNENTNKRKILAFLAGHSTIPTSCDFWQVVFSKTNSDTENDIMNKFKNVP